MTRLFRSALVLLIAVALMLSISVGIAENGDKPVIGISWSYSEQEEEYIEYYDCVIIAAGGVPVHIPQIVSTAVTYDETNEIIPDQLEESGMLKTEYAEAIKACDFSATNLEAAMNGVDGVFFVGGEDISPSLFAQPQTPANNGEGIYATRDVSDYLLMAYCIENDIPLFAACRGEQMLGIVSGCQFAQDIPNYFAMLGADYPDTHRMPPDAENRDYARHDVDILPVDSKIAAIVGGDSLADVSSWHHQAVIGIEGTDLTVTAVTNVNGVDIIEGIERMDKTFCVGTQFHPENDVYLVLNAGIDNLLAPTEDSNICSIPSENGDPFTISDFKVSLGFFQSLVAAAAAG